MSKLKKVLPWMRFWPPYFGAGIRVTHTAEDFSEIDVEMNQSWWNQNYVGTAFGGSLYSMVDPFYMLMLMECLGREYLVWDKAATIRFLRPGRGRVRAQFRLSREQVEAIRAQAAGGEKVEPQFQVRILDDAGEIVAEVDKTLWVKRKPPKEA